MVSSGSDLLETFAISFCQNELCHHMQYKDLAQSVVHCLGPPESYRSRSDWRQGLLDREGKSNGPYFNIFYTFNSILLKENIFLVSFS
jgi:hypothetical protein